jgi:hypothetical protein
MVYAKSVRTKTPSKTRSTRLVKQLEAEGRIPAQEEKAVLSLFKEVTYFG